MDRLDKISGLAIVIIIISAVMLISSHVGEAVPEHDMRQKMAAADYSVVNSEMESGVNMIRNLIEANNLEKAGMLTQELIQKYPYEGEPRMMMGDIFMRRQEPLRAVPEYKEAVILNPDYLDKKTPLFQGKKLKVAVNEALEKIGKGVSENADKATIGSYKKDIYYLQRRIAGSCS
ncbi:MAG: hypothetical protein AB1499_10545 [Nitrospirota bacterium]